jgi:hypothetical protein
MNIKYNRGFWEGGRFRMSQVVTFRVPEDSGSRYDSNEMDARRNATFAEQDIVLMRPIERKGRTCCHCYRKSHENGSRSLKAKLSLHVSYFFFDVIK